MKETIVKFTTSDNLNLTGILYSRDSLCSKIIIHVHGLSGNFYDNKFLKIQAEKYTEAGYAFMAFNNRGSGVVTEINNKLYGSAFEKFTDSNMDIDAAVNYAINNGFTDIILQGHSFGCNKVINYENKSIKGIILLAPTDVTGILMSVPNYYVNLGRCDELIESGAGDTLISGFNQYFSASTVVHNFIENSEADIFRYRNPSFKCAKLNGIEIPVCIFIGDNDTLALTKSKGDINSFFVSNITNLDLFFVDDADHSFNNKEEILANNCLHFLEDRF